MLMKNTLENKMNKTLLFALSMMCMSAFGQENKGIADSLAQKVNTRAGATTFTELLVDKPAVQLSQSGTIGAASQIMIRGLGSINLNAAPYIYVDGIPVRYSRALPSFLSIYQPSRFSFINPNDISSVKVAKEGVDLSENGGRGTNGAIYIDTDRGELGGTKIDFSAKFGLLTGTYDVNRMGAEQFKNYLRNYLLENDHTDAEVNQNPVFDPAKSMYNSNTDWIRLITRNGMLSDYHLKLKGGDGDAHYMFSVGYIDKKGTLKGSDQNQVNLRFNLDYKLSPKIEISNNLAYTHASSDYAEQGADYSIHPTFIAATKAPFLNPYLFSTSGAITKQLADVDTLGKSNPLALVDNMYNNNEDNRVDGNISIHWLMGPQTFLHSSFVFNYMSLTEKQYRPKLGIVQDLNRIRQNLKRNSSESMLLWSSWLHRTGKLGANNHYSAKAGLSVEAYEEKSIFVRKINAGSDDYETLAQGTVDSASNLKYKSKLLTFYVRGDVDLFKRMKLSANLNVEGSSNFGNKGRWGIYPGVKAVVDLFERTQSNQFAFRAGWGRTGNNDLRGYYHYNLYYAANYFGYGGAYLGNVANKSIKPEVTDTYDGGLTINLFNKRVTLDAGYYYKATSDLITRRAVSIELGLDQQFENSGKIASQGMELSIDAKLISKKELSWLVYGNISTLKNRVKELDNGNIIRSIGGIYTVAKENEALGSFYGYKVLGVFANSADVNLQKADGTNFKAGDYIIDDVNKDSRINEQDRQIIGSALPKAFGNFGTALGYKRVSFHTLFTYAVGNDIYNSFNQQMHVMKDYSNQSPEVENRWISASNPGKGLSRTAFDDPSMNGAASDLWVEKGSYLRLKNITVSYDVPLPAGMRFFRALNVYLSAENLATFTKYTGFDPEVVSGSDPMLRGIDFGASPLSKSYILGLKVSF
ncbi:TonB-linked outer membrane protein, SusC/RagA family [Pedobacter africanus]|uniref:TonB-linked outer membrane protein, SusC/RagA family n=2 Tax=Pedobacter africanus TaxID=151894 RepID=A0A1W2DLC0_9SPHI|nr:TonB-linked outer membrane protein, SusC/RagA family [Pedobacter africanus]